MGKVINRKSGERYKVPAVEQAARILFFLANTSATHMSLPQICKAMGIHSSRAFYILKTLQDFGIIQRNIGGKGYSLGPGLIKLSRKVLDNFNAPRLAEPILEELAKNAKSTAVLGLIIDDQIFIVAKYEGGLDVGITVRIGTHFHITHGAEGKVIAAFLPEKELDKLLKEKNFFSQDKSKKIDRKELMKELSECRRLGYALDLGEVNPKFNAVASPVFGPNGNPIGHITVIGIVTADWAQKLGPLVAEAAKTLSRQMGAIVD